MSIEDIIRKLLGEDETQVTVGEPYVDASQFTNNDDFAVPGGMYVDAVGPEPQPVDAPWYSRSLLSAENLFGKDNQTGGAEEIDPSRSSVTPRVASQRPSPRRRPQAQGPSRKKNRR